MNNNDFIAYIKAILDTRDVEEKIKQLQKNKVKMNFDTGSATQQIGGVNTSMKNLINSSDSLGNSLKSAFAIGGSAAAAHKIISAITKAANDAVEAVKQIDAAMTDLRIVTNSTLESATAQMKEFNETAQQMGATTTEVADSATAWLRQGKSVAETNELIKDSMMLSKIGMIDSAAATTYLTSAMNGYKVSAEDAITIVDKLGKLDSSAAITAGGLAEGMSKTAVTANDLGVSMDRLLGYLSAIGSVTQGSMSSIGQAMKTMFSRMANVKVGKLSFEDEDGTVEDLSDVETVLSKLGIKLRSSNNEFRDFGEVLDEVAGKWSDYSNVQQAAITKAFAGVRQGENFRVLMNNYEQAIEYMNVAADSTGTAEKKFSAYSDSIEAKTKTMQAAFESFALDTISTDMVGGFVTAGTAAIQFLDKTQLLTGAMAGLATVGAIKGFTGLSSAITSAYQHLNEFNTALKIVKAGNIGEAQIQQLATVTSNLSTSQMTAVLSSEALSTEQRIAILTAQGLTAEEAKTALGAMGLATSEGVAAGATNTFSGALKGLWATMQANPIILIATAVATAVAAIAAYKQHIEDVRREAKETLQKIEGEVDSLNNELETTQSRIEELLAKDSLTLVEQNELNKLQQANNELQRQLDLKERSLKIAQAKNADVFVQSVNEKMNENGGNGWWFGYRNYGDFKTSPYKDKDHPNRPEVNTTGVNEQQQNMFMVRLEEYQEAEQKYQAALKAGNEQEAQQWEERRTQLDTAMSGYVSDLTSYLDDLGEYDYASLSDDAKAAIDYISDVQNMYLMATGSDGDNVFSNIFNSERFAEAKQAISELGDVSASTLETLYNRNDDVRAMFDNMKNVGLINGEVTTSFEALANQINGASKSFEELKAEAEEAGEIKEIPIADQIDELTDELDGLQSAYSKLSGVIDDYNENGYLSLDNLQDLMALEPEYINALMDENGQLTLNSQTYKDYISLKAKSLVLDQIKNLYETILAMDEEEAQAYATATAYKVESDSLKDLIGSTTQYYLSLARAKDIANGTDTYTTAMGQSFKTVANYAAMYDSWVNSLSSSQNEYATASNNATSATQKETSALQEQKDALDDAKDALEDYKDGLETAQGNIKDLIDLTIDYIKKLKDNEKAAYEEQKTALDDQKTAYDKIISQKKEALRLAKEEREEAEKLSGYQKDVAKDTLSLAVASLDDSSAGKKAQKQAKDKLAESQKDLSDYLSEQEYNSRVAALEAEQEAFDNSIEQQKAKIDEFINDIDNYLDNARQLYNDACNLIDSDTGGLYNDLWGYTYQYTTQTQAEFNNLWTNAQLAIQAYKGDNDTLINTMEYLQGEIYITDTKIDELNTQIDETSAAIDSTNTALDGTASSIDGVSTSLSGLGDTISDYMEQLNQLLTTAQQVREEITSGDQRGDKTAFWVDYNGRQYQTGYNYNGDTEGNRLLAASELTKLIAKDISGFDNYGLGIVQGLLGVGTSNKRWRLLWNGKYYTATGSSTNAAKQIAHAMGMDSRGYKWVKENMEQYASGTYNSVGGVAVTQEDGLEMILQKLNSGQFTMLEPHSHVLKADSTERLHKFADNPRGFIAKMGIGDYSGYLNEGESLKKIKNIVSGDTNKVQINNNPSVSIQVHGDVSQETIKKLQTLKKDIIDESVEQSIKKAVRFANINRKPMW